MIFVYVAGPFSAPTREGVEANIFRVVEYGVKIAELGFFPVIPHANTADPRFEKVQDYPFWIEGTMGLMERSDVLFLIPGWEASSGSRGEHARQKELCKPIFTTIVSLFNWGKCKWCSGIGEREYFLTKGSCKDCNGRGVRARP